MISDAPKSRQGMISLSPCAAARRSDQGSAQDVALIPTTEIDANRGEAIASYFEDSIAIFRVMISKPENI
jgi:hypothetical protein